jgi:hypothetical protein
MAPVFRSVFLGGFECSNHVRRDGKRLDLLASTRHDVLAKQDYERLISVGILAARDGVPWPQVDRGGGRYDWSRVVPMLRAARETRMQVVWDLFHFGYPDGVDFFGAELVDRFRLFARAFARLLADETDETAFVAPANEISFLSWSGGDAGFFNPFAHHRGDDVKAQIVRATLAAIAEIRAVLPEARIVHPEPIIDIVADPTRPQDRLVAENYRLSQFQAWDMIAGRQRPELGGSEESLDILGLNYYVQNQWIHNGAVLVPSHPQHLPVRYMIREVWERYGRPLFLSETGIESDARVEWMRYIGGEARAARRLGVPLEGVCWYPIVNHPGWEDDRHCENGLWDYADATGGRPIFEPLARELARQQRLFAGIEPPEPGELADADRDADVLPRPALEVLDVAARDLDAVTTASRKAGGDEGG